VQQLHRELIEYVAEFDEHFDGKILRAGNSRRGGIFAPELHRAIQRQVFVPLFAVSAETNVGVARLMDFSSRNMAPSPLDRADVPARDAAGVAGSGRSRSLSRSRMCSNDERAPASGELSLFRLFAGNLRAGDELTTARANVTERLGQLYVLNGRDRTPVQQLHAAISARW